MLHENSSGGSSSSGATNVVAQIPTHGSADCAGVHEVAEETPQRCKDEADEHQPEKPPADAQQPEEPTRAALIQQLVDMGFVDEMARTTLDECDWDMSKAIDKMLHASNTSNSSSCCSSSSSSSSSSSTATTTTTTRLEQAARHSRVQNSSVPKRQHESQRLLNSRA
jgi:hypothetical protein